MTKNQSGHTTSITTKLIHTVAQHTSNSPIRGSRDHMQGTIVCSGAQPVTSVKTNGEG